MYLMFLAVSIIDFCLQFTGLPTFIALDVLGWLESLDLGGGASVFFQLIALIVTMFIAILLGMGMPAVPAYINVALLMGPVLDRLGIATFTAHMFIFYFAVASAITPPVALAAFAAASITKGEPMATGFSAMKSGIVIFIIPFIFALYPEILLIEAAQIDPNAAAGAPDPYLPKYDGSVSSVALGLLLGRVVLALYLLSSALAGYGRQRLSWIGIVIEVGSRLIDNDKCAVGNLVCNYRNTCVAFSVSIQQQRTLIPSRICPIQRRICLLSTFMGPNNQGLLHDKNDKTHLIPSDARGYFS